MEPFPKNEMMGDNLLSKNPASLVAHCREERRGERILCELDKKSTLQVVGIESKIGCLHDSSHVFREIHNSGETYVDISQSTDDPPSDERVMSKAPQRGLPWFDIAILTRLLCISRPCL